MSDIHYNQLKSLSARQLISALFRDGFRLVHQQGSHQQYGNADGRRVTVTFHSPSQTFPLKTLKSMLEKQAHWNLEDLKRLDII